MNQGTVSSYAIGFGGCLLFTLAAYFLFAEHLLAGLSLHLGLAALGVLQACFYLYFYLELGKEQKPHWNMIVFLFMLMVTVILVAGSIWIMYHLNYNLMMKHD